MGTGNRLWKYTKRAEFKRQRKAMGYGPGFLAPSIQAAIWARVKAKLPAASATEVVESPWVLAKRAQEQMTLAERNYDPYAY